jgi:hypothetical protein
MLEHAKVNIEWDWLASKRLVDIHFVQIMLLAFSYVLELMFLVKYDFLEWVGLTFLTMHEFLSTRQSIFGWQYGIYICGMTNEFLW